MIVRLSRRLRLLGVRWSSRSAVDYGLIVLARDLFLANKLITSTNKVPLQGALSSIFDRSVKEIESGYAAGTTDGGRLQNLLENSKEFPSMVNKKAHAIQSFLGPEFSLLPTELACVIYGLSNVRVNIGEEPAGQNQDPQCVFPESAITSYDSNSLRKIGKSLFQLHLQLSVVFNNNTKHLTVPSTELAHRLRIVEGQMGLICDFMKRHFMYSCIEPFKAANFDKDHLVLTSRMEDIHDATAVGGFYTLIGLLSVKFDKQKVIDEVLYKKVLNGRNGIVELATKQYIQSRKYLTV